MVLFSITYVVIYLDSETVLPVSFNDIRLTSSYTVTTRAPEGAMFITRAAAPRAKPLAPSARANSLMIDNVPASFGANCRRTFQSQLSTDILRERI